MDSEGERLSALVGHIYQTVTGETSWTELLADIGDFLGSEGMQLFEWHQALEKAPFNVIHGYDAGVSEDYAQYYARQDFRLAHLLSKPVGTFRCNTYRDDPNLVHTKFYHDYMKHADVRYTAGATFSKANGRTGVLAMLRPHGAEPFGEQEAHRFKLVLPHLMQAARLGAVLAPQTATLSRSLLERIDNPAALLDNTATVRQTNAAMDALLYEESSLRVARGQLRAVERSSQRAVRTLIDRVLRGSPAQSRASAFSVPLANGVSSCPRALSAFPIPGGTVSGLGPAIAGVLVMVSDANRPHAPALSLLTDVYALTPAEARLAVALAGGNTLEAYACARGTSYNTVRSQLHAIYRKTSLSSQSELVKLLLTLPSHAASLGQRMAGADEPSSF